MASQNMELMEAQINHCGNSSHISTNHGAISPQFIAAMAA